MVWPRDRNKCRFHLWFHRFGNWFTPSWLGGGIHPDSCRRRFHDRLSDQYRSRTDPWTHGHHRLQVCPFLYSISGLPDHPNLNSTRAATFHVIINTLKGLGRTKKDAAFGLVGLFSLYAIRMTCDYFSRRFPRRGLHYPLRFAYHPRLTAIAQPRSFSSSQHSVAHLSSLSSLLHPGCTHVIARALKAHIRSRSSDLCLEVSRLSVLPISTRGYYRHSRPKSLLLQSFCCLSTSPLPSVSQFIRHLFDLF